MVRWIIWIVALAGVGVAATIAFAGPGARLGMWDYGYGLSLIRSMAMPAMVLAGLNTLTMIYSFLRKNGAPAAALVATAATVAAAATPLQMRAAASSNPFIHDITTDFDNPPLIVAAAELDRKNPAAYAGAEPAPRDPEGRTTAEAQAAAFPEIKPLIFDVAQEEVITAVRAVLSDMGMEILADGAINDDAAAGWRIEAAYTSPWFGFVDDFIVRATPTADGGARVDIRSKSRVGTSDLGANAARIKAFSKKLRKQIGA